MDLINILAYVILFTTIGTMVIGLVAYARSNCATNANQATAGLMKQ